MYRKNWGLVHPDVMLDYMVAKEEMTAEEAERELLEAQMQELKANQEKNE